MLSILSSVNQINKSQPSTFYETSFVRAYGRDLKLAETWLHFYKEKRDAASLQTLWHYYTTVFYSVKQLAKELRIIDLADASPYLGALRDSDIPVPGTYEAGKPVISIRVMGPQMTVMESKQRPRKMAMTGSDGVEYTFLLKAHEDTRLDERVMQLFSFINTFVEPSTLPLRSRLSITTYQVIPITAEVGLIGWVPDCNILFDILRGFRERNKIEVEVEWQYITAVFPKYDALPIEQKTRAFQQAFGKTKGLDLKVMLFNGSADSADWLDRRTNFTASLATTSMAGYILGLGDRHMCNIMMKQKTGKLVHIDFGDCFEVAQHRQRFPEKVPFRLTRLLINTLEVSGIKGTFRSSCQNLMVLLRQNSAQIVGLLSVFVDDPLRQWYVGEAKKSEETEAVTILNRIKDKLNGNDFDGIRELNVEKQVDMLIEQATAPENLCKMFKGWYPWW
jgi:FKBP12-rapamycin complex-associated protein